MPKKATKVINVSGENVLASEEYYLNNPNLPRAESTYAYTPQMLQTMDLCRKDIVYFAEHFFYINGINGKEHIKLFDKQKKILKTIQNNKKILLITSRQWGKCITYDTKVTIRLKWLPIPIKIKVGLLYKAMKICDKLKSLLQQNEK